MSHFSNEAIKSVASEAIISKDGKIQRRLPNYETIVDRISNDSFVAFPALAANESLDDIPVLIESIGALPERDNKPTAAARFKRQSSYILGMLILGAFAWSIYSIFFSSKDLFGSNDEPSVSRLAIDNINVESQLKEIADKIIGDNNWSHERITGFLNRWNMLDESTIRNILSSSWYKLFTFNLQQRVKQELASNASHENNVLLTLAIVTGIINENYEFVNAESGKSKYRQLIDDLEKEIANAEKASKTAARSRISESELNARLRAQYATPPKNIQGITTAPASLDKKSKVIPKSGITASDITNLISQYKTAYESGDMRTMARLFGAAATDSRVGEQLAANFSTIFGNSEERSINFYEIETQITANTATIHSKFNASIEFKNNKGTQYIVASSKMDVQKRNGQLTIASFNILDKKVRVVAPVNQAPGESRDVQQNTSNTMPTAAELQDITTQLVAAYESGNINKFLSLFSEDIKTNDRIDLVGVKQDYTELFQNTSDRQMFIQNMKWSNEVVGTKGIGDLEVTILSDEGRTVYSMEGKIQIVAQKLGDKVLITHLYHIEREK